MATEKIAPATGHRRKGRLQFTIGLVSMAVCAALIGPLIRGVGLWAIPVMLVGIALGAYMTTRSARTAFDRTAKDTNHGAQT